MQIVIAPYCEEQSQKAGATREQIKVGQQLVELAVADSPLESHDTVDQTDNEWIRLPAPKFSCRALVSVDAKNNTVTLHVILPRDSQTYYKAEALWAVVKSGKIN
jgi:hypothetical protein